MKFFHDALSEGHPPLYKILYGTNNEHLKLDCCILIFLNSL